MLIRICNVRTMCIYLVLKSKDGNIFGFGRNCICSGSWLPKAKQVVPMYISLAALFFLLSIRFAGYRRVKWDYAQFRTSKCIVPRLEYIIIQRHCQD